jgi:hypothetical protein
MSWTTRRRGRDNDNYCHRNTDSSVILSYLLMSVYVSYNKDKGVALICTDNDNTDI